ncbi:BCS1 N terminal-domain-containing protein [Aspergillus desertorum]
MASAATMPNATTFETTHMQTLLNPSDSALLETFIQARYIYSQLYYLFQEHCVSTAEIRHDDEVYNYLMYWLAQQPFMNRTTHFYWAKVTARDKHKKLPFTPSEGTHYFWFNGRPLAFIREKQDNKSSCGGYDGYSTKLPSGSTSAAWVGIQQCSKNSSSKAQRCYVAKDSNNTVIYRGHKSGAYTEWSRKTLDDIKEYLHPRRRRWYSNRGIPYRRGYLLHGPPGAGKTSLCFAAAGLLGMELHLLNLSSKSLDEDELKALFTEIADTKRTPGSSSNTENGNSASSESQSQEEGDGVSGAAPGRTGVFEKHGVSLSGLLNVVDGVAACEGRILVVTTNHPEKLDPALVRPGRIDMSVAFRYFTTSDIKELFSAIYSTLEGDLRVSSTERLSPKLRAKIAKGTSISDSANSINANTVIRKGTSKFSEQQVRVWAEAFAERVPAGEFTPAEIQGYLLNYKTNPEGAVEGPTMWVGDMREKKAKVDTMSANANASKVDDGKGEGNKPEVNRVKNESGGSTHMTDGDAQDLMDTALTSPEAAFNGMTSFLRVGLTG